MQERTIFLYQNLKYFDLTCIIFLRNNNILVMKILVAIATLFVIGSTAGYIIELLFRRFVSQKKWMNPGFMVGPYIPLYGFGVLILYGISNIRIMDFNLPEAVNVLLILFTIGIGLTLIELVAGLIFIKLLKMKLWDYSNQWGNFKGLICPLFSLIWFGAGVAYYFLLNPILVQALYFIAVFPIYDFFIGIVIGMMIVDFAYSLHLGIMIKKFAGAATVKFDELKETISDKVSAGKKKGKFFVTQYLNKESIKDFLRSYFEKQKEGFKKTKEKSEHKK